MPNDDTDKISPEAKIPVSKDWPLEERYELLRLIWAKQARNMKKPGAKGPAFIPNDFELWEELQDLTEDLLFAGNLFLEKNRNRYAKFISN